MSLSVGISYGTTTATLTAESTSNVYGWSYQIDGGSWHTIYSASNTSKKSVKTTITELSLATSYTIRVRARTTPASSTASYEYYSSYFTTLRRQILNSVDDISVDNPVPTITFRVTFNDSAVSNWDLVIFFSENFTFTMPFTGNKSGTYTIKDDSYGTLESEFAFIMNEYMSNKTTKTFKFDILPRGASASSSVAANRVDGTFYTSAQYSAPDFNTGILYFESTSDVYDLINNQNSPRYLLQRESIVKVQFGNATAKNGASISSTKVTIGDAVGVGTWDSTATGYEHSIVHTNSINLTGELPLVATVIDSRGYSASITIDGDDIITVLPYQELTFDEYVIKRVNDVEDNISASIKGSWQSIVIDGVEYNALMHVEFRYKQMPSGAWSSWVDLTQMTGFSASGNTFEFEGTLATLSGDYAYQINFIASDKLFESDNAPAVPIPKATPLMSFREGAVGVLTNNPTFPLDVNGLIGQNGKNILGWQRQLGSIDNLNDITETGIYTVAANTASTDLNYPVGRQGYLQVMKFQDSIIFQIYYVRTSSSTLTPAVYIRTYYSSFGTFSNWFSFTLT